MASIESGKGGGKEESMPRYMVFMPVGYIVVLISAAVSLRASTGASINLVGLSLPAAVLWFGALGGVVSSLQGMFFHNAKWDPSYNLWHWFSGAIGASYGMASYLFLIVIARAAVNGNVAGSADVFALGAFAIRLRAEPVPRDDEAGVFDPLPNVQDPRVRRAQEYESSCAANHWSLGLGS
jgi:hypothetical protein